MASGARRTSDHKNTKKTTSTKRKGSSHKLTKEEELRKAALYHEIYFIGFLAVMFFMFICNFKILGPVGNFVSNILFGLFGLTAYIAPLFLFWLVAFWYANEGSFGALRKIFAGCLLFVSSGIICEIFAKHASSMDKYSLVAMYSGCSTERNGGGILAGSIAYLLLHYLETIGTVFVVIVCILVGIILFTEKSLLNSMKSGGQYLKEKGREESLRQKEYAMQRRMEQDENRARKEEMRKAREEERRLREEDRRLREEERRLREEEIENEKILRMEKKVSGVMKDTALKPRDDKNKRRDDIHEITIEGEKDYTVVEKTDNTIKERFQTATNVETGHSGIHEIHLPADLAVAEEQKITLGTKDSEDDLQASSQKNIINPGDEDVLAGHIRVHKDGQDDVNAANKKQEFTTNGAPVKAQVSKPPSFEEKVRQDSVKKINREYHFPPIDRLKKGVAGTGDSTKELRETALRLQQTLQTFGVKVTITDISQGPSVTRYELQPEQGVKVSKIVGLTDDIKLNLAATDIRIEAPIPGKAAIGIEVPNKENSMVALRDLLESKEFKEFSSNLAFAVGKDIAGKTIVTDIAKMPHMLIAGATGSGKSVCINTLIMSILYKAHPDDVKLIMVDPKVVELSVYNGIPHLLIPVVTDPKKASAALHWAVSEMEDRYRKFADFNVRDLKGYNEKVLKEIKDGNEEYKKLPQIVIIVDELADLMMVSPGEVEESICRLAQLARACGIHLIIATQRPSVDVITGLIKANMPSRVAFAVSSGVDSRTILDMVGAEKLLGKGDMLFYPQNYSKPARIQGAFVSDNEVSDVVDFLKNQEIGNTYDSDIQEKINNSESGAQTQGADGDSSGDLRDEHFAEAGKFIIEKDKASIGMLQRVFRIGFNRAARIMDQLCEYGVVSEEEGTKPRKVLMSMDQFEQLLEEI